MNTTPPTLELDQDIIAELASVCDIKPAQVLERAHRGLKPCIWLRSKRASDLPLRHDGLTAWLKRPTAEPVLPTMRSKFGGIPYDENSSWSGYAFLAQINFSEVDAEHLGFPQTGILGIDHGQDFRVRWYPNPSKTAATRVRVPSVGRYECSITFEPGWSMPGTDDEFLDLFKGFPQDALDVLMEWLPDTQLGSTDGHQMGGWRAAGLFEHYGFAPPAGLPQEIQGWTMILRLDFDNQADFAWGSNVVYVIAPNQDVANGDLSRAMVVAANF